MSNDHPLFKRKMQFFMITAFFVVLTAAFIVFFLLNVRIQTVELENCVYSQEETVLKAANIKKGTHSYGIDKNKIAKAIKSKSPFVTDVRIKRTGLTSVSIILTEDAPRFYIDHEGYYVLLSETLRALYECASLSECPDHWSIYPIELMPIEKVEIGKTVVFKAIPEVEEGKNGSANTDSGDDEYEGDESESSQSPISILPGEDAIDMLTKISSSPLSGTLTHADLSDRFDIRFTYKNKYEIRFGAPRGFDEKLELVIKTIAYLENPENEASSAKGIIHANVIGETSFESTGVADTPEEDEPDDGDSDDDYGDEYEGDYGDEDDYGDEYEGDYGY